MGFMTKFRKFMYGRYGIDELYSFLLKLYIGLVALNIFLSNSFIFVLELGILFIMFYRTFSKKIYIRKQENIKFLNIKKEFVRPLKKLRRNISDKEYIYKKCPKCKKTLKLPIPFERGIKYTKCPNCKNRVTIFTFKKQKIEIIKKKSKILN